MTPDPTVLGYLGRALSLEFSVVQQFLATARLLETRGIESAAKRFQAEATEEMGHVERLISRMLALGVAPNTSQLRPVRLTGTLPELVNHALDLEREITGFYTRAVAHCSSVQAYEDRLFFDQLLQEERHHLAEFEQWYGELTTPTQTPTGSNR
ncbi:MAG: ferritin-like domain-containing protein [Pseudomonadota bacterium]